MALGAGRGRVLQLVLRRGAAVTLVGIMVGLIGGWSVGRILAAGLYGVRPTDPLTLALVIGGVATVGMVATLLPALRATRVDPITAIRQA